MVYSKTLFFEEYLEQLKYVKDAKRCETAYFFPFSPNFDDPPPSLFSTRKLLGNTQRFNLSLLIFSFYINIQLFSNSKLANGKGYDYEKNGPSSVFDDWYDFLTFTACFSIPIIFSNFDFNFSNLSSLRNLQEQVKKAFCYQELF